MSAQDEDDVGVTDVLAAIGYTISMPYHYFVTAMRVALGRFWVMRDRPDWFLETLERVGEREGQDIWNRMVSDAIAELDLRDARDGLAP